MIKLENIKVILGNTEIIPNFSYNFEPGKITVLMGANGAGKSTILKTVCGIYPVHCGNIIFQGHKFKPKTHLLAENGIGYIPQNHRIFNEMSVKENILIGGFTISDKKLISTRLNQVLSIFPQIKLFLNKKANQLSGGQRQIVSLARSMMLEPKVLILDEPSIGLAPKLVQEVFEAVKQINLSTQTTIIIVEHNLKSLLKFADNAVVLSEGEIILSGTAQEISEHPKLKEILFGKIK